MTEQQLYKIWQQFTSGWEVIHRKLTKEQCDVILNECVANGENPNDLKATPDYDD
jgi:uncharacterized protein YbdZ (MbtH family)